MGNDVVEVEKDVPQKAVAAVSRVEENRAIAEVKAAIVVAKSNPRDTIAAQARILQECKRKTLAEQATYAYQRGSIEIKALSSFE